MLGAGVDPRMFVQDYSGFTRAAEIQAQGMQNLGATIGQGIKDFGEARQERKKIDAEIKATSAGIESAIKMGKDLGIDIGSYLSPIQAKINDPNTSPAEALALGRTAAQGISNAFTLGIGAQDRAIKQNQLRSENAFRLANLEVAQQRANIYGQKAQAETSKLTKGTLSFFDPDTNQSEEMDVNYDPQGRPRVIGTGELIVDPVKFKYGEGGVEKLPEQNIPSTSQVDYNQLPSDGNWGFTSKTRDQLPKSTAQARQVSLDFNAAANKNAKGIEIIIPNDASRIERMAAEDYVQQTQKYFADRGVDVPVRGVRTAKENGRGTPGRFHTEPFFVGDTAARKVMESDPDGYAQVLANTLGKINNVTFIAPHKTNDPGASDGKFNERDFAKGSIIPALERLSRGDFSRQAMGTPEQQAEVSRMIEQGSGMATSQATPSRSMSTEPSLAQQQPQLPARRQVVATRPVGGGQQPKTVKVVSGEEAQRYDLPPSGTYEVSLNPDGSLADTEKIIPPISEEQLKKETKIEQEQALRSAGDAAEGIRIVNKLTQSSGFAGVFGAGIGLKYLPATETRTAENYRKKLVALATTDTMRKFQGLGQMSDKEFGVAQDSATMLSDPGISEEAAASELNRLRSYFATSIRRAEELGRIPKGTAQKLIEQSMSDAGAQGSQSNQAESDASFIQGFQSGE